MQKIFSQNLFTKYESGLQRVRTQPAFTLVELIVVITIVGILSTIGFVAYSGYLGGARDGNRMASLTKLSDSLQTYAAAKSLPLPDDAINIEASGSLIAYQGYVGENVLETIDFTNGGKDPKDDSYYTYYLTKDRKKLQLLTFLEEQTAFYNSSLNSSPRNLIPTFSLGGEGASYKENSVASLFSQEREFKGEVFRELKREQTASLPLLTGEGIQGGGVKRVGGFQKTKIDSERIQGGGVQRVGFVQKSFASDYSNRYPKTYGQKLGVLISSESTTKNTPAQEISANINAGKLDVVTTNSGYTAMIDEDESITGTGILIRQSIPNGSCKRIKQLGESKGSGEYTINPGGIGNIQVYCDMETDGGGWTLVMKTDGTKSTFSFASSYWIDTNSYNDSKYLFDDIEFKSPLFATQKFSEIGIQMKTGDVLKSLVLPVSADSLYALFSSHSTVSTSLGRTKWMNMVPSSSLQPYCNIEGINIKRSGGSILARIGFSANNENDCGTNDSTLGIGTSYGSITSGNACGSTLCSNGNIEISSMGYIFIR